VAVPLKGGHRPAQKANNGEEGECEIAALNSFNPGWIDLYVEGKIVNPGNNTICI
jgi:hypothetical protein